MASPSKEHMLQAAQRYLQDWRRGTTDRAQLSSYMSEDVVFHSDGLLYPEDLQGLDTYIRSMQEERSAYQLLELKPLAAAAQTLDSAAFLLSRWSVKNVGPWRGQEASNRVSSGIQVDELRFGADGKVSEAWVKRQMTAEERSALVARPVGEQPAFDDVKVVQVPAGSARQSPADRAHALVSWAQSWNLASDTGSLEPLALEAILDPGCVMVDATGTAAKHGESWQDIQTSMAALDAIDDFTRRYTISEAALSHAADEDHNVGFLHWRATVGPKAGSAGGSGTIPTGSGPSALSAGRSTKEAAVSAGGVGGGSGTGKAGTFVVDAIDLVLFSEAGRMKEVFQFRRPLASERREVLGSGGGDAVGGAKAGAPAGVPDVAMQPAECC